jgi:hypothetical protein
MKEADARMIAVASDFLEQWHKDQAAINAGRSLPSDAVQRDRLENITRSRAFSEVGRRWKARVLRCLDCNHPALSASLVSDILSARTVNKAR